MNFASAMRMCVCVCFFYSIEPLFFISLSLFRRCLYFNFYVDAVRLYVNLFTSCVVRWLVSWFNHGNEVQNADTFFPLLHTPERGTKRSVFITSQLFACSYSFVESILIIGYCAYNIGKKSHHWEITKATHCKMWILRAREKREEERKKKKLTQINNIK